LKLERWRFLDLNQDSHTPVAETQKFPLFSGIIAFHLKSRSAIAGLLGFYTKKFSPYMQHADSPKHDLETLSSDGATFRGARVWFMG
jgi:hypothetical protein